MEQKNICIDMNCGWRCERKMHGFGTVIFAFMFPYVAIFFALIKYFYIQQPTIKSN
jgi:hypothetical protein